MSFADGVVNAISRYKRGFYFSPSFVGDHSWNGFENNLLFESIGNKRFSDVARAVGVDEIKDSRAVAIADLNLDGKLDLVIQNNNETPTIYLNNSKEQGRFLQIKLIGDLDANRDAIGTRVTVAYLDNDGKKKTAVRWVEAGNGHSSQSQSSLHFGLGICQKFSSISISWPDGTTNTISQNLGRLVDQSFAIQKQKDSAKIIVEKSKSDLAYKHKGENQ